LSTWEVLQLLLGGGYTTARPTDHPDRGRLARWSRALISNGWLARSVAAVWMNVLVLVAVGLAFFTLWGGFTREATAEDIALAALKIFRAVVPDLPPGLAVHPVPRPSAPAPCGTSSSARSSTSASAGR
jgi:hypothetical protein